MRGGGSPTRKVRGKEVGKSLSSNLVHGSGQNFRHNRESKWRCCCLGSQSNIQIWCSGCKNTNPRNLPFLVGESFMGIVAVSLWVKRLHLCDQVSSDTPYEHALDSLSFSFLLSKGSDNTCLSRVRVFERFE